ncbi:hypothetical protein LTR84_001355 [Exophiala bonariae]|uniref:FAD/NAD(P)-binding domain-containing protein n=1 Tax=Exophiala bonariae TaxID=1690606 RepID=A0AAV9NGV8_9EURO|nr:hypothetical protein LTR84_001355 [Exophiala bonariae]
MKLYDSLIIGAGPAGLSAALGLGRVHRSCVVFSNSSYRNAGVHAAHSILGHDGKSPEQIRQAGRKEVESYGHAEFIEAAIEKVRRETNQQGGDSQDAFVVEDNQGRTWSGRSVVLATGVKDQFPDLPGYVENWPSNIYQCMFCDGHERHHLPKGIFAYPKLTPMYIKFATMAHFLSLPPGSAQDPTIHTKPSLVTVFTNGPANPDNDEALAKGLETLAAHRIKIDERPVTKLVPDQKEGLHVHFGDSESVYMGFLVHKPWTQPSRVVQSIIDHLGIGTVDSPVGTYIATSPPFNSTVVPGVFVVGDAGTMITAVTSAIMSGAAAAAAVSHFCNDLDDEIALKRHRVSFGQVKQDAALEG